MQIFLKQLKDDEGTKKLYIYFKDHYFNYVLPETQHIYSNMHSESLHKTLKYDYLDVRHCTRLDKTLHALLRFTRNKKFKKLIKLNRMKPLKIIKLIE